MGVADAPPRTSPSGTRAPLLDQSTFLTLLGTLFFCSGAAALVYQMLWLRMLGWVFGVTVYAASTVWASFMAGLAIGSLLAGRVADGARHPLRWFAGAEALVGATALATPSALHALQRVYVTLYPSLPQSLAAMTLARLIIAFALLIVPTALMGATLPLVLKSSGFEAALGRHIGRLYAANTAGAIVGTMAAGLYLIPSLGIQRTFILTATINALVAAAALALSAVANRVVERGIVPPGGVERSPDRTMDVAVLDDRQLRAILAVFTVSGVVALAVEVVWFRVLTLFLRPTVYGFAVMLATVLAGIAIGSWLVAPRLDRRAPWVTTLAVVELALGVSIVCSFAWLVRLPKVWAWLNPALSRIVGDYLVYPISAGLIAILPTMLLMGAAFPIGLRLWAGSGRDPATARRIGVFYSLNVAGSIVGSLLAGFVLLPRLGSQTSLVVLGAIAFASGLVLLALCEARHATRLALGASAAIVFGAAVWRSPDPFDQFVAQRYPRQQIVSRAEAVDSTVVIHRARNGELSMTLNGNHQAGTNPRMVSGHRSIGHLPMVLHPRPRQALVIGLGGGATAGATAIHSGVDVDVVELSAAVVDGSRYFTDVNYAVLTRPNVHLRVDDGRNYLMLTRRKYDVVTEDVIHPMFAGSGNLYSREYFELIRRALNPGALVLQWVAGTEAEYKLIARTFLSVFPETTVWGDGTLLVGSVDPQRLRRSDFVWKQNEPGSRQALADMGFDTFEKMLAFYRAGPEELRAFVGAGPVLTDDRPLVEYFLSLRRDRDIDLEPLKGDVRSHVAER